jgi:hypothetical protein
MIRPGRVQTATAAYATEGAGALAIVALALPRRCATQTVPDQGLMRTTPSSSTEFDNTHNTVGHRRGTLESTHGIKTLSANPIAPPHRGRISAYNRLIRWRMDCHCRRGRNTDLHRCLARYHASHDYCVHRRCSREPTRKPMVGAPQSDFGPIEASIDSHFSASDPARYPPSGFSSEGRYLSRCRTGKVDFLHCAEQYVDELNPLLKLYRHSFLPSIKQQNKRHQRSARQNQYCGIRSEFP